MIENPFFHRGPIHDPAYFYNRKKEVKRVLEMLGKEESVSVSGPRKIGKTSFLRYVSHPATLKGHDIDPQRNVFVYIDCQHELVQGEEPQVYNMMLERIVDAARRASVDLAPEPCDELWAGTAFEQALKEMSDRGLRTILLLDEFELMAQNPNLAVSFFNNLRALSSASDINMAYVAASRIHLVDLCLERESLLSSPFFNIFQPIRLGLFSEQDSRHLVEDSLRRAGTRFPRDLLGLVLKVGGGHPFFLQMAGYWALDLQTTKGALLQSKDLRILAQTVQAQVESHFKYYWSHLTLREKYVLAALTLTQSEETYWGELESLTSLCLIVKEHGRHRYFSPLFRDFVRRQEVSDILQVGPFVLVLPLQRALLRENPLPLSGRLFALLKYLMERPGQVVSNEELDREVMASPEEQQEYEYLGDERLKSTIKRLRKALGGEADCIVNKPGEGYMLQTQTQEQIAPTWAATVTEGERRKVTVLFADVVGFTLLTERHMPEEILNIMKPALRMFVDAVDHYGGEVMSFGGDSIMALFGVPTEQSDDAIRAVHAALAIQTKVAAYARKLNQSKGIDFSARVGLDTGVVALGEIGGEQRAEYTALGDPVNLAQRLKTVAQPKTIVISDHTYQQVHGRFEIEPLGPIQVKGKSKPIQAYRVLEEKTD